jgi:outer membrane protein OmpA-like peptidoglycan-associated protein
VYDILKIMAGTVVFLLSVFFCSRNQPMAPIAAVPAVAAPALINEPTVKAPAAAAQIEQLLSQKNIEFVSGKAETTVEGQRVLDEIVAVLATAPDSRFEVAGHTDSRGLPEDNRLLSRARARVVVKYLVSKGLSPERFRAAGYGSAKPLADNASADGRQKNRRIEFVPAGG